MTSLGLGDTLCVVIWQDGLGDRNPLGYPVGAEIEGSKQRIEVVNGEVDSVVQIRIESIRPNRVIGRIIDDFAPDTPEWENARKVLGNEHDLDTEIIEQSGGPRLMIRSTSDYENQWKKQRQKVLDQIPERD